MCNVFSLSSSPDEASFADQLDLNARLFLFYIYHDFEYQSDFVYYVAIFLIQICFSNNV